ncbi:MAG: exodeoxyribonuclease VII large subunit [Candidatus Caccovivens sp.]
MTQAYTLTVTKFNNIIKSIFNSEELLHNIKIVGEVFGISRAKNQIYFSLKDEESSLSCVSFYADVLENVCEGDMVEVVGSPNYYTKTGRFNFLVTKVQPFGLGLLYQRFLELKNKLESEGLFAQEHKKPVPECIKRIGVVTSKDGAVIQDIKNVTWRRNRAIDIVLYSCKVQGIGAENEIAKGIEFFSNYDKVDVVIVARGGGSLEDLSAYNTEVVARATYNCQKPIVSAVGHETDFTIVDFVSDLRAPTPSAAAELLTKDTKQSKAGLIKDLSRLSRQLDNFIADKTMTLANDKNKFVVLAEDYITNKKLFLDKLVVRTSNRIENMLKNMDFDLKLKCAHLNKHNPLDILALGYAKIEQDGKCVKTVSDVDKQKPIEINFMDGKVLADVRLEQ